MAHPRRDHLVPHLVEDLGITDDKVVWDTANNRWHTGRRAMASYDPDCDWHVVVQDDAIVCADFLEGMAQALEYVPDDCIVQPYVGTGRPIQGYVQQAVDQADAEGACWIEMRGMNWGVAVAVPTWTIESMLVWCDRRTWPNYDKRVGQYYLSKLAWSTWYTWPSLVDHMDPERDGEASLVSHGGGRIAHRFLGRETSALSIDWSGPVVRTRGVGTLARRRAAFRKAQDQQRQTHEIAFRGTAAVRSRPSPRGSSAEGRPAGSRGAWRPSSPG